MEKTYVAVMNYEGEDYLEDVFVLGWDNDSDWFDSTYGDELLTNNNNLKRHPNGLVHVGETGLYIEENKDHIEDYAKSARREGYDCVTCELFKDDNGEWKVRKAN